MDRLVTLLAIKKSGIFDIAKTRKKGNPLLGICLGMQMLLSKTKIWKTFWIINN